MFKRAFLLAVLAVVVLPAWAQFRVEVSGVGLTQIPIVLAPFKGQETAPQAMVDIVQADLTRSGQFVAVASPQPQLDDAVRPDMAAMRAAHADAVLTGSVRQLPDGRFDLRFRLWDAVKDADLGGQSLAVVSTDLRLAAHRVADYVYEKLTGDRGVFSTRIAYVTKTGTRFQLWVADADGENAQPALSSPEPIISPAWSPDGNQLAYVSFEARKPVVYVHDVRLGKRRLLANFKGSNSAPAWSPDGQRLALTLSRDGGSQLFLLDARGGEPRRLTTSGGIDTEPVFAADGQTLYFVSDRGGAPQIYRMALDGGSVTRVTYQGGYNISPAISADGRWLAYISRIGSAYKLHVMDLSSGTVRALTDTAADESPSFAPNGKLLVYATRGQGREALMTTTLDGQVKARLNAGSGDIREPAWGPFFK